jgi:hypothetical protein
MARKGKHGLGAVRLERDGRLAELRRKYALEAEVSLLSILRLYLPPARVPWNARRET